MNRRKEIILISITIISSASLLLFSLTKNIFFITGMKESIGSFGLTSFFLGWLNLFGAGICWLANPFLILSWATLIAGSRKRALIFAGISLFFSLLFLTMRNILANEGGSQSEIIAYDTGYWLWLSSCIVNCIGNLIVYKMNTANTIDNF